MIRDESPPSGSGSLDDVHQEVRVIDTKGQNLGVMTLSEALNIARGSGANLVKIVPTATPPIYRLVVKGLR